ncbi:hypothetical protein [Pseudomonas aeruginosa]|uniref:hypothetical protein n=1 Tax=Pseudomonas aeruginosa TaxID=287 RepID=UPI003D28B39B
MSKRKRAVLGLDWTIEPPRNASAAEKADAEYLHELLLDLEGIEDSCSIAWTASATAIALSSWTGPPGTGVVAAGLRPPATELVSTEPGRPGRAAPAR